MDTNLIMGGEPLWMWGVFFALFLSVLVFDLNVINKKDHVFTVSESIHLTLFYAFIALLFAMGIWAHDGFNHAGLFVTGYLVEVSLSMDNIFVISLVLSYFVVPKQYQHRLLFWGILGVIGMRGLMIGVGTSIVSRFEWVLLLFAAFLVYTGIKMMLMDDDDDEEDLSKNAVVKFFKKHMRVTGEYHGHDFIVRKKDSKTKQMLIYATPMLLTLCVVEVVDVIFAVDSIPAILAITQDPFIVYTSNLFAIMGLRSMYFALSAMLERFQYLEYAISIVLTFIGVKVLAQKGPEVVSSWLAGSNPELAGKIATFAVHLPPWVSLLMTVGVLIAGGVISYIKTEADAKKHEKKKAKK